MRTYKRKNGVVPHNIMMQVRYKIADYDRLLQERDRILHGSGEPANGMPHGSDTGHPTEDKAVRLAAIDEQIQAIEQAVHEIGAEYSHRVIEGFDPIRGYWDYNYFNYRHKRKSEKDDGPSYRTWQRYRVYFTAKIARRLKLF